MTEHEEYAKPPWGTHPPAETAAEKARARAHLEALEAMIAAGPETRTVELSREQFDAAIYALRKEAHRQDPAAYPRHHPAYPDYDPWPSDMSALADYLEQKLIEAGADVS